LVTKHNDIFTGLTGCRFVSNDSGQPAKRVIATPFIGTRLRGGNTERGIGVEYFSSLASHEGVYHIFATMESKNPKEYLRALEILNRMEKCDPDVLVACAHACKKQASLDDNSFRWLKKYQPLQMEKVLEKREVVFKQPCDEAGLKAIIIGFHKCGFPIDDTFAQASKREAPASWNIFPKITGKEINAVSLAT